jgi:hypothetical protein
MQGTPPNDESTRFFQLIVMVGHDQSQFGCPVAKNRRAQSPGVIVGCWGFFLSGPGGMSVGSVVACGPPVRRYSSVVLVSVRRVRTKLDMASHVGYHTSGCCPANT